MTSLAFIFLEGLAIIITARLGALEMDFSYSRLPVEEEGGERR